MALVLAALGLFMADEARPGSDEVAERLVEAMRHLPEHSKPLHAIGDVNEDGKADDADRLLVRALAKAPPEIWPSITEATCPAAADLNLDGLIDANDVAAADDLLKGSRITAPALFHQPSLPCRFEHLTVAVQLGATPGERIPLWVIDPDVDFAGAGLAVESGPATAAPAANESGKFWIEVESGATNSDILVLKIVLGRGRVYWLSLPVYTPTR